MSKIKQTVSPNPINHELDIQLASTAADIPDAASLKYWVEAALVGHRTAAVEVVIRIVDEPEMLELNQAYRHKTGTTNILSFPFDAPDGVTLNLLGDLVVCAPVVAQEAAAQSKRLADHWAHIIIHGIFHLLGYDHIDDAEADIMEALEIAVLNTLNINNPYLEPEIQ